MKRLNTLDWISLVLLIVGGLNWGLIGLFSFDLVAAIFGDMTVASRVIYTLIGIAAVVVAIDAFRWRGSWAGTAASGRAH
jgi:uncharacterized protein